jgi:phosphatidylserine/phosphatidylglycerophosphate/cardiolipin synthase-like enzyme
MIKVLSPNIALLCSVFLLSACSPEQDSVPLSKVDHCLDQNMQVRKPLAEYIAPHSENMKHKSGVYVLEQGTEAMMSRAWLTSQAQQSIDIQYFIFSTDNIGLIATDYLVRAAERGVKVRVLVDDIMVEAKGDELLMLAAHENVEIKIYNPNANIGKNIVKKLAALSKDFHGFNQRMHNKVFIVDGQVAITGGRNIADEYFGFDHSYNFRDRDVFLAGKVVADLNSSFEEFWQFELSQPVERLVKDNPYAENPDFTRLHSYACNPENFEPAIRQEIEQVPETFAQLTEQGKFLWLDAEDVEYVSDIPGKNDGSVFLGGGGVTRNKLIELAESAQSSIVVQSPYLVTTAADRAFFKTLTERGVEIKIVTNSLASTDNLEAFSGYQRDRSELLSTGVEIYEFKPDAKIRQRVMAKQMADKLPEMPIFGLHAKTMTIDDNITVIGTYNLDPRSANLNTESLTVIRSKQINDSVKGAMLVEMAPENAWKVTEHFNPDSEVSAKKRIAVKLRRVVPKGIL